MSKDKLDDLITKSYEEIASKINADPEEAYQKFLLELEKRKKINADKEENKLNYIIKRHQKVFIAAGFIGAFILGSFFTENAIATKSILRDYWTRTGNSIKKTINIGNEEKVDTTNISEEFQTIAELKEHIKFILRVPNNLPENMVLNKALLWKVGNSEKVTLLYTGQNQFLQITEWLVTGPTSSFTSVDDKKSEIKHFTFNNITYEIVVLESGNITCKYNNNELLINVQSKGISYEEFIKILKSMKEYT
ncbi:MAG: hypothetical protein VR72_21580 [Clostridiaceae bacterium BRH_c20a]|nr:MAG: hypothetical protein VR72_21580 [Clostridiaceae bacterium BRH_c20a]